jgi:hypothetical protein
MAKKLINPFKKIPKEGFLEGKFGEWFFQEYENMAHEKYESPLGFVGDVGVKYWEDCADPSELRRCSPVVYGLNTFQIVLANEILKPLGLRTAAQTDLERMLKIGTLDLRKTRVTSGLVLKPLPFGGIVMPGDEKEEYLAKRLERQLKERNLELVLPVLINLFDLELVKDRYSPFGLKFRLAKTANPVYAPILDVDDDGLQEVHFRSKDINKKRGLPQQVGKGRRVLYRQDDRLCSLDLEDGVDICASRSLTYFSKASRLVIVNIANNT